MVSARYSGVIPAAILVCCLATTMLVAGKAANARGARQVLQSAASGPTVRLAFVHRGDIRVFDGRTGQGTVVTTSGHDSAPRWVSGGHALLFQRTVGNHAEAFRWEPGSAVKRIQDGLWSLDGNAVAIVRSAPGTRFATAVWVIRGARTTRVTPADRNARWLPLAWSSSGSQLALARLALTPLPKGTFGFEAKSSSVWVFAGRLRRLNLPALSDHWPDAAFFSPGGRFLTVLVGYNQQCVSCRADGGPYYALPTAGGKPLPIGSALKPDETVSSAPDGSFMVFSGGIGRETYYDKHLVRVDLPAGKSVRLTQGRHWSDVEPAVSPDGRLIAFARGMSQFWHGQIGTIGLIASRRVFVMDGNGSHLRQLTGARGWTDDVPTWSSDGKWLVFVHWRRQIGRQPAAAALWTVRADGTGARRLVPLDLPPEFGNGFGYYGTFGWKNLFSVAPN